MGPRWLKVEPLRLAMLGGVFFGTLAMVFYFIRQLLGAPMEPEAMLLGVARTFLVSYAGTGFFVWYILRVADDQLSAPAAKNAGLSETETMEEEEEIQEWETTGPPPEEPEEPS